MKMESEQKRQYNHIRKTLKACKPRTKHEMANSNLSEYQDKLLQNISALSKGLR
jgi:hypothetical protein